MAKKTKKTEPVVTQEQLIAVAEDFNTFMVEEGEEGIDTELEYDDLLAEVMEAAADLVDEDVITQETADTLEALGIDHVAQVEEEDDDGDPEDNVDEEEEEEEEEEEADPDGESIEEMLDRAKANKIPVPPPYRKDKAKLQVYLEKKMPSAPAKAAGKKGAKAETKPAEKKGKAAKKAPATPKERTGLNRGVAVYKAIEVLCKKKGGATMKNIMAHSDELVVASGGKSNPTATNVNKYTLDALVHFEVLVVNDGKYTFA